MFARRIIALGIVASGVFGGWFVSRSFGPEAAFPFRLGLDLSGGTHLVYRADVSQVESGEVANSMDALRDLIERRVNLFGVAEPIVQVQKTVGVLSTASENRLIVELPGVTDIDRAVSMIGRTPLLEFKLERPEGPEKEALRMQWEAVRSAIDKGAAPTSAIFPSEDAEFMATGLTGRYIERASLAFDQVNVPRVVLEFNSAGDELFAEITRDNVGKTLAIYLDGAPISTPTIQEEIRGGRAEISGGFTPVEAKELAGRLNAGALPVPIELLSSQTIGASLGAAAAHDGVMAGLVGLVAAALFMILWYRLPGIVSVVALGIYVVIMLALFLAIPVTLTAAGIAGFILSIGMAVDANVLIFERMKEEMAAGASRIQALEQGFARAWTSIRDSNISSIITAVILFWFGSSLIKGFALVFALGVMISMFTAITVSRTFLKAIVSEKQRGRMADFFFGSGIK